MNNKGKTRTNPASQTDYIWPTVCEIFFLFEGRGSIYTDILRQKILLHNIKRGNLKVKQIVNQEENRFHEEAARLFALMSVKNSSIFLLTFGLH